MKQTLIITTFSLFLFLGSSTLVPSYAQTIDIPTVPNQEEKVAISALKSEHAKLTALLPRLETTLTILTKRGFDTTNALASLEETKRMLTETKELFEKKSVKRSTLEDTIKDSRALLAQTLKEIRLSLKSKEN
jgi:ABC-type transporter Mla subunit MlaD